MPKITEFVNDAAKNLWDHDVNPVSENAVSTGHKELDQRLGGLERGEVYLLGGVSGIGTTALAVDITYKIAVKANGRVFYHTNQSTASDLTKRLICLTAKIQWNKNEAGPEDEEQISEVVKQLSEADVFISDKRRKRTDELLESEHFPNTDCNLDLIVIDRLDGMYDAGTSDEMLWMCKYLAKEYNCPILVVTELEWMENPRAQDYRPSMECFRALAVSKYVDTFMALYRDEFFESKDCIKGMAELHILKSKYCNPHIINLVFLEEYGAFVDCA